MRGYDKDNIRRNAHEILSSINVNLLHDYCGKEEAEKTLNSLQRVGQDYRTEKESYEKESTKNQNQTREK